MSKICKKCDVLETNDNNDYCGICANELVADLEAKLAESEEKYNMANRAYWELVEKQDNAFLQYEKLIGENQKLTQQLEAKDKAIENWQTMYQSVMKSSHNGIEEDKRLREQLAEKEKEIESLATDLQEALTLIKEGRELVGLNNKVLEQLHQDKISFALEQLTETKQRILQYLYNMYDDINIADKEDLDYIFDYIFDNQIKQLKEMK